MICAYKLTSKISPRFLVSYISPVVYIQYIHFIVVQTLTYKTAAFEPVDAATPADAQKIELKETEHSLDYLVPGPVKYVTSHVAAPAVSYAAYPGLLPYAGLPVVAAPAAAEAEAVEEA